MCFKDSEISLFVLLPKNVVMPFKNLRLTLVLLSHFTKLVFVFGSGKLSEIGIVVQKGHAALDYDHTF